MSRGQPDQGTGEEPPEIVAAYESLRDLKNTESALLKGLVSGAGMENDSPFGQQNRHEQQRNNQQIEQVRELQKTPRDGTNHSTHCEAAGETGIAAGQAGNSKPQAPYNQYQTGRNPWDRALNTLGSGSQNRAKRFAEKIGDLMHGLQHRAETIIRVVLQKEAKNQEDQYDINDKIKKTHEGTADPYPAG